MVTDEQFPFALHYFTGSKEHNIRMRQRAIDRGLTLNEYSLGRTTAGRGVRDRGGHLRGARPAVHRTGAARGHGRDRGGRGEEAPRLVRTADIRGVFHNHTTYSDGTASLEEMALAAKRLGFEYSGSGTTRSRSRSRGACRRAGPQAVGRDRQGERETEGVRIIKGSEVDILEDGSLDYDDELLAGFDYVVASVTALFAMPEDEMTAAGVSVRCLTLR